MEKNILISTFSKHYPLPNIHSQGDYNQRMLMSILFSPHSKDRICRRRAITMHNFEPVTAALLENSRTLWSIFLCDPKHVSARRKYCLGFERSWCGTILSLIKTKVLPRLKASLRQEGSVITLDSYILI